MYGMADTRPTEWPTLSVPGLGDFLVKLDMGIFYDIEAETGKDYYGVVSGLYGGQGGTAPKLSTVQIYDLIARGIRNADASSAITGRQLAANFAPGDNLAVTTVLAEALKKTQLPTPPSAPSTETKETLPVN